MSLNSSKTPCQLVPHALESAQRSFHISQAPVLSSSSLARASRLGQGKLVFGPQQRSVCSRDRTVQTRVSVCVIVVGCSSVPS